ncbi:MAG TPA: helix-turn-helix transcriptional regulator [Phycisphaerae bacterium]|nr:helix-turn-helix transcriptional regulator [Phycisphaerae bacterium]
MRAARVAQGLSQEALAHACDLHRTYIGQLERGEVNVTVLSLRKVTRALKI